MTTPDLEDHAITRTLRGYGPRHRHGDNWPTHRARARKRRRTHTRKETKCSNSHPTNSR